MASPFSLIFTILALISPSTTATPPVNTKAIIETLTVDFYKAKCPNVEKIVSDVMSKSVKTKEGAIPGIIRLHFHDCFISGCDGSILLTPQRYNHYNSEEANPANANSLRGMPVIDEIKAEVEKQCPNTVTCADILAYAARDAIALAGSPRYAVPAGRRDGGYIDGNEASNLPKGGQPVEALVEMYADRGLTVNDLVVLEGSHSIGRSRCTGVTSDPDSFKEFPDVGKFLDKTFNSTTVGNICTSNLGNAVFNTTVPLNPEKKDTAWGVMFYQNMLKGRGVIPADLAMALNPQTKPIYEKYAANAELWKKEFNEAMIKLGKVNVLTGTQGDVRKKCTLLNSVNIVTA